MFIVFDLDDTLIETSKCLTPVCLQRAFQALVAEGIEPAAFDRLMALNAQTITSHEALDLFCGEFFCNERQRALAYEAFTPKLPLQEKIEPVPGAIALLERLSQEYTLALITRGAPALQLAKMEKAGIQPEIFSKLIVSQGPSKKMDYQCLINVLNVDPREGVVVGDRIDFDLTPAKELGLFTVHFRNGRGKVHTEPRASVDWTIETLTELQEVFARHES